MIEQSIFYQFTSFATQFTFTYYLEFTSLYIWVSLLWLSTKKKEDTSQRNRPCTLTGMFFKTNIMENREGNG